MDLRAKITEVLSAHEYAGKPGGPDCGGVCDCPDLCTCGAEVRAWRQHVADAVMGLVETTQKNIRADTLFWAARQLRNVPVTCTALTGPVWYGSAWQDAANHLLDLAGWEPSDHEAECTYLATRVRELEADRDLLQRKLDTVEGKRPGTWDTWEEHIARQQATPPEPQPKPRLTLEAARHQAAEHARALEEEQ